tara:strand:- start:3122 stop:5071 length:1950 start_codon:yes stop_codon:yes gene_type:complete
MALVKQRLKPTEAAERTRLTTEEQVVYDDIMSNGLQNKFDHQLSDMRTSHDTKATSLEKIRDEMNLFPQSYERSFYRDFINSGMDSVAAKSLAEIIVAEKYECIDQKYLRGYDIANRLIPKEQLFRSRRNVLRAPVGTTYYADSDNGSDANDGLGTGAGNAWATVDKFTESARSAGDDVILRGGRTATYDLSGSLSTTSDGEPYNRIRVSADYGDAWGDHVNTSGTATVTVTHGSKTITASADISSVVSAGDIIYISGDDNLRFSYEVDSVVTTTITLFLPYKGDQTGSGLSLINMQSPPIWDDGGGASVRVNHANDDSWHWRGLRFQSGNATKASGVFDVSATAFNIIIQDCQFISSTGGSTEYGLWFGNEFGFVDLIDKCRFYNFRRSIYPQQAGSTGEHTTLLRDSLIDGNSVTSSQGILVGNSTGITIEECEFKNNASRDVQLGGYSCSVKVLNSLLSSASPYFVGAGPGSAFHITDHNQDDTAHIWFSGHDTVAFRRSGLSRQSADGAGSEYSIKFSGYDTLDGTAYNETTGVVVFNYAIKHDTDQFTVDVWLRPSATFFWITDPTPDELFLELAYRVHASNKARYKLRSTGTIDMNGSTAWQKLTVTATPGQAGVAYLKLYYGKTLEFIDSFYVDPRPEIYKS